MRWPLLVPVMGLLVVDGAVAGGFPQGQPYTWLGHLETADGPFDGTVSAEFVVVDGRGVEVDQVIDAALIVVDGDFVVDFAVPDLLLEPLFVRASIGGVVLSPELPLEQAWPSAFSTGFATGADVADVADGIGGLTRVLSRERLASGSVEIPLAQVTGFPAAFVDGDQGLDFTPGATLDFANGTIGIKPGSLPGTALNASAQAADLIDGTLTTGDLRPNGVNGSDFLPLGLNKLAPKSLTGRNLGVDPTEVFSVTEARCLSEKVGNVVEFPTCLFTGTVTCTATGGATGHRPCAGLNQSANCFPGTTSQCPNASAGVLVFP